jgi:hypothetical protein
MCLVYSSIYKTMNRIEIVIGSTKTIDMNREKLEKNIASNLTIDLDVEKFIEVTLLDIEKYANQRVIQELEMQMEDAQIGNSYTRLMDRIKELKQWDLLKK